MSTYQQLKFDPPRKRRKGRWLACETCQKEFYITPARIRQNEKRGNQARYCSMECYKKDGTANPFWGKSHAEATKNAWRADPRRDGATLVEFNQTKWAEVVGAKKCRQHVKRVGKCQRCGFPDYRILERHHKDRNRSNNHESNIEVLCPNCHALEHYNARDGHYTRMKKEA